MARLPDNAQQLKFRLALESRLKLVVDPNAKAFFYGALSYDHIYAVAYSIKAIKDDGKMVNRENLMAQLRMMDFEGATGHVSLVPGTNDRANMPLQIFNNHGYQADGKTVKFVSVGAVNPETGKLSLDEQAILWPGATRTAPAK